MPENSERPWQPLSPAEVALLFEGAGFPWWIAGGHAIEHAAGRSLRPHGDIDLLLLRKDQSRAQRVIAGWDCWAADPPGELRPWLEGEVLPPHVSDVWCAPDRDGPWRLQLMLDEGDEHHWTSRRSRLVTKPLAEVGVRDRHGVPFLAAEIQLFYKAKSPRPKDELDFVAALPSLNRSKRAWLRYAILAAYGAANSWLEMLG